MAFDFHKDKQRYFKMQYETTRDYILPMLKPHVKLGKGVRVLEIGCAEAGVLKAFTEQGCTCLGIELASKRLVTAREFMKDQMEAGLISFMDKNIHDVNIDEEIGERFDLVILKDVIEHIHDQKSFILKLREYLKPSGFIFYAFPPWQMPFGGHQQVAKGKLTSKMPYYHLLPMSLYKMILKFFNEKPKTIENLIDIKQTGISIERFEKVVKKADFEIISKEHYLFNPIYKYKFGLTPKKQLLLVSKLPVIRNFFTTGVYYLTRMH